jgi:hypothetical protein
MVPQSARNSRGENLRIELNIATSKREELLTTAVKAHIVPILHDLKRELIESTLSLRGELLSEKETLEELEQREQQLHESLESFDQRIKRAEQTYKREKEALESAAELQRRDWDEAELRLLSLRDTAAEETRINTANRRLAEMQAVRRAKLTDCEAKKAAMMEEIMEIVSACASHRETVQAGLEDVKLRYGRRLEAFLAAPPIMSSATTAGAFPPVPPRATSRPSVQPTHLRPRHQQQLLLQQQQQAINAEEEDGEVHEAKEEYEERGVVEEEEEEDEEVVEGRRNRPIVTKLHQTFDRVALQQPASHSSTSTFI